MPPPFTRTVAAIVCAVSLAVVAPRGAAQITYDGNESISVGLSNDFDGPTASLILGHLQHWLGAPTVAKTTSLGPSAPMTPPCPPVGTPVPPIEIEIVAQTEPGGPNVVEVTIECLVVTADCFAQPMQHRMIWKQPTFEQVHTTFIVLPPYLPDPPLPPPPPPVDDPPNPGGYSVEFVSEADNHGAEPPCALIRVVVTPWGEVLDGETFAERHPEHVPTLLAVLEARTGQPFTTGCVEFIDP